MRDSKKHKKRTPEKYRESLIEKSQSKRFERIPKGNFPQKFPLGRRRHIRAVKDILGSFGDIYISVDGDIRELDVYRAIDDHAVFDNGFIFVYDRHHSSDVVHLIGKPSINTNIV